MTSPASGTLPEPQVRAMFDRIAGVYDRMNSVMTAGMHHRWRERAVDLAGVRAGSRALDVATGTGDLAIELQRRGAEVVGLDFSTRDARAGAREGSRNRVGAGQRARAPTRRRRVRRGHGGLWRPQLLRPRPWSRRDDARGEAGGARGDPRDHDARAPAAVALLLALVRPRGAGARAPCRRLRRLQLSPVERATLSRPRGAGRADGRRRPARRALGADRRRDHRHPCGSVR